MTKLIALCASIHLDKIKEHVYLCTFCQINEVIPATDQPRSSVACSSQSSRSNILRPRFGFYSVAASFGKKELSLFLN